MRLNVGCGDHRALAPWVNVDATAGPGVHPDVVADIRSLPYPDGAAERVYCGHVLEHLAPGDVVDALHETRRVLAPGGLLCVVGPDRDRALLEEDPDYRESLVRVIETGCGRWTGDTHLWVSTETATLELVREVFPAAAQPVPIADVPSEWPVVSRHAWWQFAIHASKET